MVDGDVSALESLYDRHSTRVLAICLRILRDRDRAEEVMQDTFWQLWQRPDRFDPVRGRLSTFLAQIARSRSLDRLRAERSRTDRVEAARLEIEVHGDEADLEAPDARLALTERGEQVRAALAQLDVDQREIVGLTYFEGLSRAEAAERLALPIGTVKTRLRRGLERLRRALAQGGFA